MRYVGEQPSWLTTMQAATLAEGSDRIACCEEAVLNPRYCVCAYFWECPEHGETHVGTHD